MENKAYFDELSRVLKKRNIESGPVENGRLTIQLNGQPINRIEPEYEGTKTDFAKRSGLIQKGRSFTMNISHKCSTVCRTL